MCHRTNQRMDVMEQCINIVRRNQTIIHSQRDEPLLEFLDVPVYPLVPDPYVSLTPAELATFGIGPSPLVLLPTTMTTMVMKRRPTTTRRQRMTSSSYRTFHFFESFPFLVS
jgi:hypothetical protein